jgi:hypothetical protein
MEQIFSVSDLHHFVALKLCFFIFVVFCALVIYKKIKPWLFILLFGIFNAVGYYILVHNTKLMFWGLKGDEITISAMYNMFAHGSLLSDFAYSWLAPFYPSLFFQFFGLIGRFLNWNGIQIAKFASFSVILVFPIAFYLIQKFYWSKNKEHEDGPDALAVAMSAMFVFFFAGWNSVIIKPYELVSAGFAILWTVFFSLDFIKGRLGWSRILIYGITGGILFWMFYFWFFLSAIGISIFNLFAGIQIGTKKYMSAFAVALLMLAASSIFWLPLALDYLRFGSENFQLGFFAIDWIKTNIPIDIFSISGILMCAGFVSLFIFRKNLYIFSLLCLFISAYVWQAMGLSTILFFDSSLQESKGFVFWTTGVLALSAGYGLSRCFSWLKDRFSSISQFNFTIAVMCSCLIGVQMLFGFFADNSEVMKTRSRAREFKPGITGLAGFLQNNFSLTQTVISSGIPDLLSLVPVNYFIYFNQHNSHPAAGFSQRYEYVKSLQYIESPEKMRDVLNDSEFGKIDALVFYKGVKDFYPIYFHLDDFPYKIKEEEILISKKVFNSRFFDIIYENNYYIVLSPKPGI